MDKAINQQGWAKRGSKKTTYEDLHIKEIQQISYIPISFMATTTSATIMITKLSTRELMAEILKLRKKVCFISKVNATVLDGLVMPKFAWNMGLLEYGKEERIMML